MNFRPRTQEAPEINLIPFIDVLLVVLIFLMLSTTYSKFTEMQLKLPVADTDAQRDYAKELIVAVMPTAPSVNRVPVVGRSLKCRHCAGGRCQGEQGTVVISAQRKRKHQSVVTVMEATRRSV
jgi:biopolymer transport protein ExbD